MEKENFKKNSQNEFNNKWYKEKMYGQFVREILEEIHKDLSWKWLGKVISKCKLKQRFVPHKNRH